MSRLRSASLCLTDILEIAKTGHSAFSRSDKNKFGQNVSIQLSPKKDTDFEKTYIGNGEIRPFTPASETPNSPNAPVVDGTETDDVPF